MTFWILSLIRQIMYISGDTDMIEGEEGGGEIEREVYEVGNDRDYHDPINNRLYRLY